MFTNLMSSVWRNAALLVFSLVFNSLTGICASPVQGKFLGAPARVAEAVRFVERYLGEAGKAKTRLEYLEKQVEAKKFFDQKRWWEASQALRAVLKTDGSDLQGWYMACLVIAGMNEGEAVEEGQQNLENALTQAYMVAGTDLDRAVILWTAATLVNRHAGLRKEALNLATEEAIKQRIETLSGFYPVAFVPYLVDLPQRTNIGTACISWTRRLLKSRNFNYGDYVRVMPQVKDLAVIARGDKLCFEGLEFGGNYQLTFLKGFQGDGHVRLENEEKIDVYVAHRKPSIQFRERGYILPAHGPQILPFSAINIQALNVRIYHLAERNLAGVMDTWFNKGGPQWWHTREMGESQGDLIWNGTFDCKGDIDKTVSAGIPVDQLTGGKLKPGVYVVEAFVHESKYDADTRATQVFVVSDIGLATFFGPDGLHVYARSHLTAEPLENVEIALFSRNNRELGRMITGKDGYATFPDRITKGTSGNEPAFVEASKKGEQFTVLSLRNEAFDLSDRGVHGRSPAGALDAYMYTERGIYRAGEKLRIVGLLREHNGRAATGIPLTLRLFRPDGVEVHGSLVQDAGCGSYVFEFALPDTAPSGSWSAVMHIDPKSPEIARTVFAVHDFVPPRIEVKAASPDGTYIIPGKALDINVMARYYYGPPGARLKVEGESILVKANGGAPGWKGYTFGLEEENWAPLKVSHTPTITDEAGKASVRILVDSVPATSHLLQLETTVGVFEPGGRVRNEKHIVPLWHQPFVIGISPRFMDRSVPENSVASFDVIAVDRDGKLLQRKGLRYTVFEEDTDYIWFSANGSWQYETVVRDRVYRNGTLDLEGAKTKTFSVPVAAGQYRLEILDETTGVATSFRFSAGWFNAQAAPDKPDMLDVRLAETSHRQGDKARVYIRTPFAGMLSLSMAGDKLTPVYRGKIGKEGITLDIPLKGDNARKPGSYLVATVYRPGDAKEAQLPGRAIGVAWLDLKKSSPPNQFTMNVPKVIKPGSRFNVTLSFPEKRKDQKVAVAVVDEGILSLVDYKTPDPYAHFWGQTRLAYELRDTYGSLINPYGVRPGSFEVGGDAINARALARLAARPFTIVSLFSGVVESGGREEIRIPFDVPAFSGKLRVMAVAWNGDSTGSGEASVTVREDMDLYVALPRFFAPHDKSEVPVILHNMGCPGGDYELSVHSAEGTVEKSLHLDKGQEARIPITLEISDPGKAEITAELKGPSGLHMKKSWEIAIRSGVFPVLLRRYGVLKPGEGLVLDSSFFKDFHGGAKADFSIGSIPEWNVSSLIRELIEYPYNCLEQTSSRVLAAMYGLAEGTGSCKGDPASCTRIIESGLNHLLTLQKLDGTFSMWSSEGTPELWVSLYIDDMIGLLQGHGIAVPSSLHARLERWIHEVAERPVASVDDASLVAYAHYLMAREGKGTLGHLRYFADNHQKELVTRRDCSFVAAAFACYGEQQQAKKWFGKAISLKPGAQDKGLDRSSYGSELRDTAILVTMLAETTHEDPSLLSLAASLVDKSSNIRFLTTQEKIWLVRASMALKEMRKAFNIEIDGHKISDSDPVEKSFIAEDLSAKSLKVTNTGKNPIYYGTTIIGEPLDPQKINQEGFEIKRDIYALDGKLADLQNIIPGNLYLISIRGRCTQRDLSHIALVDLLPAGFEIEDARVSEKMLAQSWPWLGAVTKASRIEARDDRFVATFVLDGNEDFSIIYLVRSVTAGSYLYPGTFVESMYQPQYFRYGESKNIHIRSVP